MSKPSRRISRVWKHFERIGNRAMCLLCENTFAFSSGSTANLKRHLARKHPTDPLEGSLNDMIQSEPSSPADDNQWKDEPEGWNAESQQWDNGIEGILIPKLECETPQAETKRRSTLASKVWRHYDRDGTSAECHHCSRVISFSHGSTSNLKKHLDRKHPDISLDYDEPNQSDEHETADPTSPSPTPSQSPWTEGIEGIVVPKQEYDTTPPETDSKRTAEIWKHYHSEGTHAKCHYCDKILSSGTPSNLKKHLSLKHPMVTLKSASLKKRTILARKMKSTHAATGTKRRFEESLGRKQRLGNRRLVSRVWDHYDRDGKVAKCHHCDRVLTYQSGTTSNLMKHLHGQHPSMAVKKVETEQEDTRRQHIAAQPKSVEDTEPFVRISNVKETSGTQLPPLEAVSGDELMHRYAKVVLMCCRGNHPLTLADEEGFQALVPMHGKDDNRDDGEHMPPKSMALTLVYLPLVYEVTHKNVKAELATARAISLTVGSAASINDELVFSVSSYFIDEKGTMSSVLLDFSSFMETDTVDNVAAYVGKVMNTFEIEGKINAIVTDSPANVVRAVEKLNIPHVPCFAHALEAIVLSSLNVSIQSTIDKVRHVVLQLRRSAKAMELLGEAASHMEDEMLLEYDVPGNWSTTLKMLDMFTIFKKAILACSVEGNVTLQLADKDWDIVAQSVKVLQVLDTAIAEVTATKMVTISKPGVLYHLIVHRLESVATEENMHMEVGILAATLLSGVKESLAFVRSNRVLTQAIMLDPRYKAEGFMQDEVCLKQTYETVVDALAALQLEDNPAPMDKAFFSDDELIMQQRTDELYNLFETHKRSMHDSSALTVSAQFELNCYLKVKHLDRRADPLVWWRKNKHFYPNLYKLAVKILCTPGTCASSGACCTKTELECRERKYELVSNITSQMVFLKYNHQRYKFEPCGDSAESC